MSWASLPLTWLLTSQTLTTEPSAIACSTKPQVISHFLSQCSFPVPHNAGWLALRIPHTLHSSPVMVVHPPHPVPGLEGVVAVLVPKHCSHSIVSLPFEGHAVEQHCSRDSPPCCHHLPATIIPFIHWRCGHLPYCLLLLSHLCFRPGWPQYLRGWLIQHCSPTCVFLFLPS